MTDINRMEEKERERERENNKKIWSSRNLETVRNLSQIVGSLPFLPRIPPINTIYPYRSLPCVFDEKKRRGYPKTLMLNREDRRAILSLLSTWTWTREREREGEGGRERGKWKGKSLEEPVTGRIVHPRIIVWATDARLKIDGLPGHLFRG